MMKLNKITAPALLVFMMTCCLACNNSDKKSTQVKSNGLPQAAAGTSHTIAFVEIDSIMTQYQFCKDYTLVMTQRSESYKSTLDSKMRALQKAGEEFQRKIQSGAYTSEEQAISARNAIERQQDELQKLQEQLAQKFDQEQAEYNNALRDSLQHFLEDYNKTKKYSLIVSKAGDNLLYGDPSLNITQEVVAGLNKRYKKK